jgi:hypothetical protein
VNRTRYLVATLLVLDGILHVARLGMDGLGGGLVATAVGFGVAYLAIGGLLLLDVRGSAWLGVLAPVAGIVAGLAGGLAGGAGRPSSWMAALAALDVAIIVGSVRLIRSRRRATAAPEMG